MVVMQQILCLDGLLVFALLKFLGIVKESGDSVSVEDPAFECVDSLDRSATAKQNEE